MKTLETITLARDVTGVQIPYGDKIILPVGVTVTLYQTLGGNFTVQTDMGALVRIEGKDADALGKEPPKVEEASPQAPGITADTPTDHARVIQAVWDVMRTCYDPEIPVNIVDLGLIYECSVAPLPGGYMVDVKMTVTAPGCGMGPVLQEDVRSKIEAIAGVKAVNAELVWEPPWDQSRMTEAARLQLGM